MKELDAAALGSLIAHIQFQATSGLFRVTQHAQQEMVEEEIDLNEVLAVLQGGEILEHYPGHKRGACCLVSGLTTEGRPLHIVCTTAQPLLILITVYEPRPPKWLTPQKRRGPQ